MSREVSADGGAYEQISALEAKAQEIEQLVEKELERESKSKNFQRVVLLLFVAAWMTAGTLFFLSEGYRIETSLYGMMQIITTVGYGDVLPRTEQGKIFGALLVLLSSLVISGALSEFADAILDYQTEMLTDAMSKKSKTILNVQGSRGQPPSPGLPAARTSSASAPSQSSSSCCPRAEQTRRLIINFLVFAVFIAIGTIFFWQVESCSCSYGMTVETGCDPYRCEETGGTVKTLLDSFYMSVVTLSTVGFGDETALTRPGRWFSIFWMFFGVGSMVNFVGEVSAFINESGRSRKKSLLAEKLFRELDSNRDGGLDRLEFLEFQLRLNGLATEKQIQEIRSQFDHLDKNGDLKVSITEMREYYGTPDIAKSRVPSFP